MHEILPPHPTGTSLLNRFTVGCVLLATLFSTSHVKAASEFGDTRFNENALIGILYDFKQDSKMNPREMNADRFYAIISAFLESGYRESKLDGIFAATQAVYTTELFITNRSASAAPKAFGVEDFVKPAFWMTHFKGQVLPPEPGVYQFVARADGFIAIGVNGENVLVKHTSNNKKWIKNPIGAEVTGRTPSGRPRASLPFAFDGKAPIDLDVVLAEAGGSFHIFVLYRKVGEIYPEKNGQPDYPVFRLAPSETETTHADGSAYWRAVP